MYQKLCKEPFTILTTAGSVILDKYTSEEEDVNEISLLAKVENTPENWDKYHELPKKAVKKPFGGQYGCRAQTLAFDRGNGLV
jgi:hypothetical protein